MVSGGSIFFKNLFLFLNCQHSGQEVEAHNGLEPPPLRDQTSSSGLVRHPNTSGINTHIHK